jgi:hypothetical protein
MDMTNKYEMILNLYRFGSTLNYIESMDLESYVATKYKACIIINNQRQLNLFRNLFKFNGGKHYEYL